MRESNATTKIGTPEDWDKAIEFTETADLVLWVFVHPVTEKISFYIDGELNWPVDDELPAVVFGIFDKGNDKKGQPQVSSHMVPHRRRWEWVHSHLTEFETLNALLDENVAMLLCSAPAWSLSAAIEAARTLIPWSRVSGANSTSQKVMTC